MIHACGCVLRLARGRNHKRTVVGDQGFHHVTGPLDPSEKS